MSVREQIQASYEDDASAIKYLEDAGYRMTSQFNWILPHPTHNPTQAENDALNYLFFEWDFGGVIGIDLELTDDRDPR